MKQDATDMVCWLEALGNVAARTSDTLREQGKDDFLDGQLLVQRRGMEFRLRRKIKAKAQKD